ncbi:MAG: CDGSH iron-sulfur domain-containing protein [Holophagales bacterium]|mgnify:CR=1 FL=1|nr:CDGSH iron-sulfur domain-containing protein [Holophagales bacterium]
MSDPTIAARGPVPVKLEAGRTYAWCRCGLSKGQPFCDGAHKGTGFSPLVWTAEESKEAWLCQCKHTGKAPFCDGTHKKLP